MGKHSRVEDTFRDVDVWAKGIRYPDYVIMDETHDFKSSWLKDYRDYLNLDQDTCSWVEETLNQKVMNEYVEKRDSYLSSWLGAVRVADEHRSKKEELVGSKVTITFNRRLTPSEKFSFRQMIVVAGGDHLTELRFHTDSEEDETSLTVAISFGWDPVDMVDWVSEYVEDNFLNVHPVSVHTHYPRIDEIG